MMKPEGNRIEMARFYADAEGNENGRGQLQLVFENGSILTFIQGGGDCCANVYMTCDDDLQSFIGDTYLSNEILEGPCTEDSGGVHETQFLHIRTSGGTITCQGHNEHNGYYSGLDVEAKFNPSGVS